TSSAFTGIQQPAATAPDIKLPLSLDPQLSNSKRLRDATAWWVQVMGRLQPGVTAQQVQGNFDGIFQQAARSRWSTYLSELSDEERSSARNRSRTEVPRLRVDSGAQGIYDPDPDAMRGMTILGVVVAILLLIVCANVANLLLARATSRQKEI